MRLWDFALRLWPGAEPVLIELQDSDGQSAPLLLWRMWTVVEGLAVDTAVLERAVALARDFHRGAIDPLRRARRSRPRPGDPSKGPTLDLRAVLLAAELASERRLFERLGEIALPRGAKGGALDEALAEVCRAWGGASSGRLIAEFADAARAAIGRLGGQACRKTGV